jgi:hypothetical protein
MIGIVELAVLALVGIVVVGLLFLVLTRGKDGQG